MIVYLTRDTTDFARELRARFLAEGHSVYTGDALAALPAIDLFLATQDERLAGDDFTVLDGVDPEIVMRADPGAGGCAARAGPRDGQARLLCDQRRSGLRQLEPPDARLWLRHVQGRPFPGGQNLL